ncbi:MAG: ester cyclase [Chloroflexi bacterium]|nr:ester cyclase [Chloroflexota bacterium]
MTHTSIRQDAIRLYRELTAACNTNDLDSLDEILGPEFVDHSLPPGAPQGIDGFKAFRNAMYTSMMTVATIEDLFGEDDRVCARITVRGKHVGPFMGIPPTGQSLSMQIIEITRVRDGKIVERWNERDWLGLFRQMGIRWSQPAKEASPA